MLGNLREPFFIPTALRLPFMVGTLGILYGKKGFWKNTRENIAPRGTEREERFSRGRKVSRGHASSKVRSLRFQNIGK